MNQMHCNFLRWENNKLVSTVSIALLCLPCISIPTLYFTLSVDYYPIQKVTQSPEQKSHSPSSSFPQHITDPVMSTFYTKKMHLGPNTTLSTISPPPSMFCPSETQVCLPTDVHEVVQQSQTGASR
jgi:hypothetical protein